LISHAHEDGTNGAYGSISPSRHRSDRSDTMRDGRLLDTLERTGDEYKYYSSFGSNTHHDRHHYHPYMRNDRGYLLDEFNKAKPPTFDGYVNKFFELHEYTDNMKAWIAIFSLKGKANIYWEDVKWVRDIKTYDLSWREFKRLFRKKYLSKRY